MRTKRPGNRCCPSSPVVSTSPPPADDSGADMEPNKLLCPSLTVMITKTVKALCEVNIRFDNKLEISGCLHVRSDGEKVLTCLIDEETTRIKQEEVPASERHEPIVSMLNNTLATALQAATGKSPIPLTDRNDNHTELESLEESIRTAVENSRNAASLLNDSGNLHRILGQASVADGQTAEKASLLANIRNRDVLFGISDKPLDMSPSSSDAGAHEGSPAPEERNGSLQVQPGAVFPGFPAIKKEPSPADSYRALSSPPNHLAAHPAAALAALTQPQFPGLMTSAALSMIPTASPDNTMANSKPMPTVDNIPYETMEVITPKGSRTKKFQCMFCGIMLSTKGYLKNHINAVHTKSRVYPCDICERLFYSAGALRIHKLRHHWAGSKKHKCHLCDEAFLLPIELRRHLLKKHGIPENQGDSPSALDESSSEPPESSRGGRNNNKEMSEVVEVIQIGEGSNQGPSEEDDLENYYDGNMKSDGGLEAQLKIAQQAAKAHLTMVQEMDRIAQLQGERQESAMEQEAM